MKHSAIAKTIGRYALILSIICLGMIGPEGRLTAMGSTGSQVDCRVELDRDRLLNEAWGIDYYGTTRTLDQHIAQLRKKVETDPSNPERIQTVHGVGYRYNNT